MKLCSKCQFRAPDERIICLTCGSTQLVKVEFAPPGPSFKEKAEESVEQMRGVAGDAMSVAAPVSLKVWQWLASSFIELKESWPKAVSAFHKTRALLLDRLPQSPPPPAVRRRRRSELTNAGISTDSPPMPEIHASRSMPVMLRDMSKHKR